MIHFLIITRNFLNITTYFMRKYLIIMTYIIIFFLKVAEKGFHIKMTNVCSHIFLLNKSIDLFLFLINLSPNIKMVVYHKFPQKNINQHNCF